MRRFALPLACVLIACCSCTAFAAQFDLVHVSQFDVTLCDGCGITLAGSDFGLLVNKGATDITESELHAATFTATSSRPDFQFYPFLNDPGWVVVPPHTLAPIQPQEAVGSLGPDPDNHLLVPVLSPPEVLRDLAGAQFVAFEIRRDVGSTYVGPVTFVLRLQIGGEEAEFPMVANVSLGPHFIAFTQAARASSVPLPVAARPTSWGAIKSLYR